MFSRLCSHGHVTRSMRSLHLKFKAHDHGLRMHLWLRRLRSRVTEALTTMAWHRYPQRRIRWAPGSATDTITTRGTTTTMMGHRHRHGRRHRHRHGHTHREAL